LRKSLYIPHEGHHNKQEVVGYTFAGLATKRDGALAYIRKGMYQSFKKGEITPAMLLGSPQDLENKRVQASSRSLTSQQLSLVV
jgi:hypothetical protein